MVILEETPAGQALTVKMAMETLSKDVLKDGTFVINSDQVVFFDIKSLNTNHSSVGIYFNDASSSCFYDLDLQNKIVTKIKEKEKISCYASSGVFYFASGEQILECVNWGKKEQKLYNNELYLGPCMEYFEKIDYFKTMIKFDLGNVGSVQLFREFTQNLFKKEE